MADIWKVFFPSQLTLAQHGYLVGSVCEEMKHLYVHCVVSFSKLKKPDKENKIVLGAYQIIGIWNLSPDTLNDVGSQLWLIAQGQMSQCFYCDLFICTKGGRRKLKCHCILYDPIDILSSYIIYNRSTRCDSQNRITKDANKALFQVHPKSNLQVDNITSLVISLKSFNQIGASELRDVDVVKTWTEDADYCLPRTSACFNTVLENLCVVLTLVGAVLDNLCLKYPQINYLLDIPSLTRQLRMRYRQRKHTAALVSDGNSSNMILYADVCWQQVVDTVVGVMLMVFIMRAGMADTIANVVMMWAEEVGRSLTSLINWLMGAPAGLKLNTQLTQFLGHFFLYHIYLWTGYLSVLRPVLGHLLYYSSCLGLLGFSVQLCLVQDILSMLTLHIYCFYVYAARLYSLQVFSLTSLWRLFRGKKWNVLRHRVDSASYDIDQLFVGTLFFTLLFFLLPTMLLYYIVFLVLRLGVLSVKGVLSVIVRTVNSTPAFSLVLWILRSKAVSGGVHFTVVPNTQTDHSLIFTIQTLHISLIKLLKTMMISPPLEFQPEKHSVAKLLHNILNGDLIYPWISSSSYHKKDKTA